MRTCSHIKSNGIKCGSPALKYNTLCYFHYQWQNRRHYGYRSSPGEWTTLRLPPLESKASIIFAITEIQSALLSGAIDVKMAKTLLYGVQLTLQVNASEEELSSSENPVTCDELRFQMQDERNRHYRPPQKVCDSCEKAETCGSSSDCIHSTDQIREFERIHEPERYAGDRANEKAAEELMNKANAALKCPLPKPGAPKMPSSSTPAVKTTTLNPCHPERSATPSRVAAGPCVSSTPAQPSPSKRHKLFATPQAYDRLEARALNEINILKSNS